VEPDRTAPPEAAATPVEDHGPAPRAGSGRVDRHPVCLAEWTALANAPEGNGLWLGQHVLAPIGTVATRWGLAPAACGPARGVAPARPVGSDACPRRQWLGASAARGKKTGPNPTDRRKAGSKHHILTEARGIPLTALLTSANRHDVTQLLPLVDAIPPLRGCPGRPVRKPGLIQGDRGYDSQPHRDALHRRGIHTQLAKRRTPHGSGLGRTRWVVERTLAWLHRFRRLNMRYERRPCLHEAFLILGCSLICWNFLKPLIYF
jgi:transposase